MGFLGVNLCFLWGVDELTSSQADEFTSWRINGRSHFFTFSPFHPFTLTPQLL